MKNKEFYKSIDECIEAFCKTQPNLRDKNNCSLKMFNDWINDEYYPVYRVGDVIWSKISVIDAETSSRTYVRYREDLRIVIIEDLDKDAGQYICTILYDGGHGGRCKYDRSICIPYSDFSWKKVGEEEKQK